MIYAAIIPNRGSERKLFVEWQKQRAYDCGYDHVFVIDYEPRSNAIDIYERIALGVSVAKKVNADYCSIIESDDFYGLDYLDTIKKRIEPQTEIFGINQTIYYHLFSTGWKRMSHPGRSSLFCTTFKTGAFDKLPQVPSSKPYIDIEWWKDQNVVKQLINDDLAVGIKHGNVFGRIGGNGHIMHYTKYDLHLTLLKGVLDADAFEFFRGVKALYQLTWQQGLKA